MAFALGFGLGLPFINYTASGATPVVTFSFPLLYMGYF